MLFFTTLMLDLAGLARGIFSEGEPVSNFVPTLQGWFALILMLVVTTVVVLALYYNARAYQPPHFEHAHAGEHEAEAKVAPVVPADDLEIIEGIGPKIASVLQANGIRSFAQLAASDPEHIQAILRQAGLRLANASTWPEQARLAADGDWQGLFELTIQLKAGRRN